MACDAFAVRDVPQRRASSMDGYALATSEEPHGCSFELVGESAAGAPWQGGVLGENQALRVSTGAILPDEATRVIAQEQVEIVDGGIRVASDIHDAVFIREAAIDVGKGQLLAKKGQRVTPALASLLAAAGGDEIAVVRKPRVGFFANGNELVEPGVAPQGNQLVNSIGVGLASAIRSWGGEPVYGGIAGDSMQSLQAVIDGLLQQSVDFLVPVGGASVGDHDLVRTVFANRGIAMRFERVAIVPGRPTWCGTLDGLPVLGVPGNPSSALVSSALFVHAMLRVALGVSDTGELSTFTSSA